MRKLLLVALLGGAVSPAVSAPREHSDERQRSERVARDERPAPRAPRAERSQPRQQSGEGQRDRVKRETSSPAPVERPQLRVSRDVSPPVAAPRDAGPARTRIAVDRPRPADSVRDWRAVERQRDDSPSAIEDRNLRRAPVARPDRELVDRKRRPPPVMDRPDGGLVEQDRPLPPVLDRDPRRRVSRTPLPGTEPPLPTTASRRDAEPQQRWGTNWRRDKRYDWRDHRKRNKWKFHLGFYYDPFGWRYHRYGIGWRLWPSHYSSRFWLHDPWWYRLPPSYGPYRWVRYWDDALLVNIYTGQVVDVIYDFFW